ncbi:MAG: cation:proton antiporter [Mariprofundales bacterium]
MEMTQEIMTADAAIHVSAATVFVIALLIAVTAQVLAMRLRFPAIALWLGCGMLLGPFGLHVIHIEAIRPALHTLIELGLAIILFEGGLHLNLDALRKHGAVVGRLIFFGVLLTMLAGGFLAHTIADLDWKIALLFGALVAVGGPTVISPIVKQTRLTRDLRHILISEAMLVDVIGAILAIVMYEVVHTSQDVYAPAIGALITKFGLGATIGLGGGMLLSFLLNSKLLREAELRSIATLATAWGIFILANAASEQAGLLAVLVAGGVLQHNELPDLQRLRHFKADLSVLLISVLFVLLAADLNLEIFVAYLPQGLMIFVALAVLVRPLAAFLSWPDWQERKKVMYLGAMAPRGVVAAAIASLFGMNLAAEGVPGSDALLSMTYTVIIASVVFYGLMARPFSRWLNVEGGNERSVLIAGGGAFGLEMGRALAEDKGWEVRILDLNQDIVNQAKANNYKALLGNALDPVSLESLHAEEMSSIIAMTGSSDHNMLMASMARHEFGIRNIYVAIKERVPISESKHLRMMEKLHTKRLFGKHYTYSYWNDQADRMELEWHWYALDEAKHELIGERLADIGIERGVQVVFIARDNIKIIPNDDVVLQANDALRLVCRRKDVHQDRPYLTKKRTIYPAK